MLIIPFQMITYRQKNLPGLFVNTNSINDINLFN